MSAGQLARRLEITPQAVLRLEAAELEGGIRLSSLRRVAEALNCEVVYAFVPNTTLEDAVQHQARRVVSSELARVDQTMLLEAQRVEGDAAADLLNERAAAVIDTRRLWEDDHSGK
jgi:predicted DNA-binding mobile mystery protein A